MRHEASDRPRDENTSSGYADGNSAGDFLKNNLAKVGGVFEVIVDEREEGDTYLGRTRFDAPEIDNGVIFTSGKES